MAIAIDNRLLAFASALMVAGCGNDAVADASAGAEPSFQRVINVEVQPLAPTVFEERVQLTGTAQANRDVLISAEEAGVIREIVTDEGTRVSEGQAIVRIDDTILRAQVAEAEARAALARETWERRRRLFEEDGVGSELAYLEARYQAEQATAAANTLTERLARTVIRAPIDGILESREVELGSMVSPGVPVARVVEINPIKVTGGVPERYAADVTAGSEAVVTFDVLPGEEYPGRVQYVGATVNPRNRTFRVELALSNPGRIIKPEMVANIEILRGTVPDAIVVPQEALVRVEDGFVAFVVGADGAGAEVAEVRSLALGPAQRNAVVVERGLASGERLIVLGQNLVANGDRVRVVRTRGEILAGREQ